MKPIVVAGSVNMDLVSRTPCLPAAGETVIGTGFQMHPGGKGGNQAVAVARLDYPCILLAKVGDDIFGKTLLEGLKAERVDTSHVETVTSVASGTATIAVDDNAENSIIVTPGANFEVSTAYLEAKIEVLRGAGMVLAQLEIPIETIGWLAKQCRAFGVPFVLDPAPARELSPELLACVDWFTPNESEAEFYTCKSWDEPAILASFFRSGLRRVILKRGARGAIVAEHTGERHPIAPFIVQAQDTTAAGDAFNGAFAVAMMQGRSAVESARFASAAAAVSVTRPGAQPSLASMKEVEALLNSKTNAPSMAYATSDV